MKKFFTAVLAVLVVLVVISIFNFKKPEASEQKLNRFSSYEELKSFVKSGREYLPYDQGTFAARSAVGAPAAENAPEKAAEYSATNVQVTGVDEADVVKTDGKYIYSVSGNNVSIVDAYPAENARVLSKINFDGTINGIFVNKDKLVVFGSTDYYYPLRGGMPEIYPYYPPQTFILVYDISDRSNPVLARNISLNGTYFESRTIGDYAYVIVNENLQYNGDDILLPSFIEQNSVKRISTSDIYYSNSPDYSYIFTSILAINTQTDEPVAIKTLLTGWTQDIFVSTDNVYIVYAKTYSMYDYYDRLVDQAILPSVPSDVQSKINDIKKLDIDKYEKMSKIGEVFSNYTSSLNPEQAVALMKDMEEKMQAVMKEIAKELEKTIIHKISISGGSIEYETSGTAPGRILNQFSMDEYNGYFRIATTTGQFWRSSPLNHVYVLDADLEIVGRLEDLAPTETIFATRFMGDKAYMVTFRRIDPLFVIDLTDPTNPKAVGELKIPGYSDYLNPYDETHVIGVGKDTDDRGAELGVKISLFDISDFSNPKETSKYMIGARGTYTLASSDHKAFLFSKQKNLLVIPVSVADSPYNFTWQGAYVFNLNLGGISLKGRITHSKESGQAWYYYDYDVRRSLYMDDVLYTISDRMIKMNDLENLNEINQINL